MDNMLTDAVVEKAIWTALFWGAVTILPALGVLIYIFSAPRRGRK